IPRGSASASANWGTYPGEGDVDFYALYTGATASQYELVVLQEWWLTAHDHVYDNGEDISACTVEGCTYKHVHSFSGEWQTESLSTVVTKGVKYRACDTYGCTKKEYGEIELAKAVSIAVTQNPDNMYYNPGDKLDATGMVVTATADNGTTCDITKFVTIEDKELSYEDYTLTISYEGLSTTISVTMVAEHDHTYEGEYLLDTAPTFTTLGKEYRVCTFEGCTKREERDVAKVEMTSIEITSLPEKTDYFVYETLDKSGLEVTGYGANDYQEDITDLVTVTASQMVLGENTVTVSYGEFSKTFTVNAQSNSVYDVSYEVTENTEVMVEGYFVGVANEGDNADKEMLIKDIDTDDIIAIRGVSYDTFENNFGYAYGDLVRISATLKVETDVETLGKKYLEFSVKNGDKASTIISSGNAVNFSLENTVNFYEDVGTSAGFWTTDTLNRTSNFYKIIKIQGCVYGFRYGDTDNLVIHCNTEFTNTVISKFKTNGKYITFRDDVTSQNVGANWIDYFGGDLVYSNSSSKALGPGYGVLVDLYAVYTGGDATTYQLTILSSDWLTSTDTAMDGDYTNLEVMKEVTLAYFRQLGQIQYNQTIQRRNINANPEDATAQRQLYVDCSSFANAIFYEAFGMNIIQDGVPIVKDGVTYDSLAPQTYNTQMYCEQYLGQDPAIIGVWKKNTDYNTTAKKAALIEYVVENLQPGDVFNYRYGDGSSSRGHIMVYLGNNTFFHSRGGDFMAIGEEGVETPAQTRDNAWHYERCSTVSFADISRLISEDGDRGLLSKGVICWIRPLARENVTPTANSIARMQYQGLDTEKTVDKGINSSVSKGETITYTISAINHSRNDYKGVEVKEILSDNVTLIQAPAGYVLDGNTLTFNFDINHFSTTELSYTVKVNDTATAGSLIESKQTTVGGILTTRVFNVVSGYATAQLNSVATKATNFAKNSATFDNPMELVRSIYKDLGVTAFDNYDTIDALLSDLLEVNVNDELNEESDLYSMVAPDLYGGRLMSNMYIRDKDNVRLIKECNLSVGDVIIADYKTAQKDEGGNTVVDPDTGFTVYDDVYYVIYIYVGNGQLVALSNEPAVNANLNTCVLKTMNESQYNSDNVLVTLYSYSRYVVLRPSMVA
ncbi:MAG: bacterial Ig-like domain-containing protein, partial [Clostridia bacterium]|nr:bacterial Ig-like domain-containing protein [Clostridia bacterium]